MEWRIIPEQTYSAVLNMAIDEALYEQVAFGMQHPTIRFYKWQPASISLGAQQNHEEINFDACVKHDVPIVRRMTGGAAVYHDRKDFTYSIIAPIKFLGNNIHRAYAQVCSWITNALRELGIIAQIKNRNDILVEGKKISGNAAKLTRGIYFQHGTIIYDIDYEKMPSVLNVRRELVSNKVTSIKEHSDVSNKKVYAALMENFTKNKNLEITSLSQEELERARELVREKYGNFILSGISKNKGACYVVSGIE